VADITTVNSIFYEIVLKVLGKHYLFVGAMKFYLFSIFYHKLSKGRLYYRPGSSGIN